MRKNKRNLDYNQTYDNLIISKENEAIHYIFNEETFKTMNIKSPILITGDYGAGKSHILNAFHIFIMKLFPEKKIIHINAEQFVSDIIKSYSRHIEHCLYSEADIFIIDDLQYLIDKETTQKEFNDVVRKLLNLGIIVLAAFENFRRMKSLVEELKSVLLSGVHIDLVPLDEVSQKKLEKLLVSENMPKMRERFNSLTMEPFLDLKKTENKELSENEHTCSICNTYYNTIIDREKCMNSHSELITLRWLAYKLSLIKDKMGEELEIIDKDVFNTIDSIISRFGISVDEFFDFS